MNYLCRGAVACEATDVQFALDIERVAQKFANRADRKSSPWGRGTIYHHDSPYGLPLELRIVPLFGGRSCKILFHIFSGFRTHSIRGDGNYCILPL